MDESKSVGKYNPKTLYTTVYDNDGKVLREQQLPLHRKSLKGLCGRGITGEAIYALNKKGKVKIQFDDGYVIHELK